MQSIIILAIVFVIMLTAPFVGAILYCKLKKGSILMIRQEKIKDARYFGKSFADLVEKNLSSIEGEKIILSKKEEFLDGDEETEFSDQVDELVICEDKSFYSPKNVKEFRKEIYSGQNIAIVEHEVKLRAAYAKECMLLGARTKVERWVDAEKTLAVYDECNLGMSASAGKRLSIGSECKFRRLFAPEILIGQYQEQIRDTMQYKNHRIFEGAKELEVIRNENYIDEDIANEQGEADITVLSRKDVEILEHIIVRGDVRSHKNVRLCDDSAVCGNIFAEGDVHIGKNAVVLGNIFTQGNIYVEEGAMIGQPGKISSMIARETITFEKNVTVYGYVSCERGGKVIADVEQREYHKWDFLPLVESRKEVCFISLEEFEKVDEQGFRKEEFLQKVEIRVPAKEIPKSMFFGCMALETVFLPKTLEKIGAYAFADCNSLKHITDFSDMHLDKIGTSAFENCEMLEEISFPKELTTLGGAAFGGCKGLKKVQFAEGSALKVVGDHCFRGCENLTDLELPNSVERVGLSAFADCKALKKISVPKCCENEPGIMELEENAQVQVCYRSLEGA